MSGERVAPVLSALGPGREFDLIRGFLAGAPALGEEVRVGPGDDAAVLDGGWVLTCDVSVEDVHFRRAWLSDHEVGYRAAAAAISDLAAMAARPVGILVALAAPRGGVDLAAVHAGLAEAAASSGASVLGGDVSSSPGPLVVDVTAVGRTARPVLRSGARPGDELWVTGALGACAAAVRVLEAGRQPAPELRAALARPVPRVREALWLAEREVAHALIDLSDGLAGDAGHLAAAGRVKIVLDEPALPVAEGALAELGEAEARAAALHGGEDYELCFAAAPGAVDREAFERHFGLALTRVGEVEDGEGAEHEGVWLRDAAGILTRPRAGGFDHFASEAG